MILGVHSQRLTVVLCGQYIDVEVKYDQNKRTYCEKICRCRPAGFQAQVDVGCVDECSTDDTNSNGTDGQDVLIVFGKAI